MNWRKPIIESALFISGSNIIKKFKYIKDIQSKSSVEILDKQNEKLKRLLLFSYKNIPYYKILLPKAGVISARGEINLSNFENIPPLTKNLIKSLGNNLISPDCEQRKSYENTSGGSTGEPVRLIQDKNYDEWNTANKLYYNWFHGKEYGEPETKLWGSDRDILEGTLGLKENIINFLYNRTFLNTFNLTQQNFKKYLDHINKRKPTSIWAYYDSMFELAKYAQEQKILMHSPEVIFTTIGKLTDDMYGMIKQTFPNSKIIDQYGSREVGVIGFEQIERSFLSLFPWTHKVEVADSKNFNTYGQSGRILITTLENYSMPLIRYQIEDMGILGKDSKGNSVLKEVTGRIFSHFYKNDGTMVHAQFFVTLMFNRAWVRKFQFVQYDYDDILLRIEADKPVDQDLKDIEQKIKQVMGKKCELRVDVVKKIIPSQSGKYLYTRCLIEKPLS